MRFARVILFAAVLGAAAAAEQAVQGADTAATVGDLLPQGLAPALPFKSRKMLSMQAANAADAAHAQAGAKAAGQWHEPHMHLPGGGVYVPPHDHWHGDHWDYHPGSYHPPAWGSYGGWGGHGGWNGGHGGWGGHSTGGWDHHDHGHNHGHGHWH